MESCLFSVSAATSLPSRGTTAFRSLGVRQCSDPPFGMSKPEKIFVFGAGGHAKVVIDDMNPERASSEFAGYEVLGGRETLHSLWERQVRTMFEFII